MILPEKFSKNIIKLKDVSVTCDIIVSQLHQEVFEKLHRRGGVVGISGGIDSSVTLALCVRAFGKENVLGVLLPEKESNPESSYLAEQLAEKFEVKTIKEDITDVLNGFGCYQRRDEAVKRVFPEYTSEKYTMKIGIKNSIKQELPPIFSLMLVNKEKNEQSRLLTVKDYLQIMASSNFKQRTRMSMLYYHAERLHYAVIGTPNKHEVEQGFFVKYGDGGADIMPIVKLFKSQVYELGEYLGIPESILKRVPTTDTYSAEQSQEEFFYQMPFLEMDLLWYAFENEIQPEEVANVMGMSTIEINKIFLNFRRKQQTTEYLRKAPVHLFCKNEFC